MPDRATIQTEANGPYIVTGPVTILDVDGHEHHVPEGHVVKLCRCGHSAKKPFCDSTHRRGGLVSPPAVLPPPPERRGTAPPGGPTTREPGRGEARPARRAR